MSAPTPEIRTRFTLGGLRQAAEGLRAFGTRVTAATRPIVAAARRAAAAVAAVGRAGAEAGRRAARGLQSFAARLRPLASMAAKLGAGGFLAAGGAVGAAVRTTSQLVLEQERLSRAGGAATESMVGLTSAAAAFGVESDEVMGALSTLSDKIAEASRGEGAKEFFDELGISATDGSGRLRDTTAVLDDLMRATRSMNRTERASLFNELLGGDAEKLAEFLDVGGSAKAREFRELAESMGAIATPEHVEQTRSWREALERGRLALRGVALEVSRRFMPVLTRLVDQISDLASRNRGRIADFIVQGWNRAMRAVIAIIRGFSALAAGVQWTARTVATLVADMTGGLASGRGVVESLVGAWLRFLHVIVQVYAAFTGREGLVQSAWILTLRDGVLAVIGVLAQLPAAVTVVADIAALVPAVLAAAVEVVRIGLAESAALALAAASALIDALSERVDAAIAGVAASISAWTRPVREAIADVWRVLSQGAGAEVDTAFVEGIRDELISLREVAIAFWGSLQRAWAIFKGVLDTVHAVVRPLLDMLGTDVMTGALVLGMLRLSGILGGIAAVAKGLGWALSTAFGVGGTAATALTATVGALLAKVAAAAGIAVGGYHLGQAAAAGIDHLSGGRLSGRRQLEATHADNRRRMDESYYARLATAPRPAPSPAMRINASNVVEAYDLWGSGRGKASETVDVNFNVGRATAQLSGTRSAVDELTRALTDARAAGGLRG